MSERVPVRRIVEAYEDYETLAGSAGFSVRKSEVRQRALKGARCGGAMKALFSPGYATRHASHTAPAEIADALTQMTGELAALVRDKANGALPKTARKNGAALVEAVRALPAEKRAAVASHLAQSEHGRFLKPAEISVQEFQRLLKERSKGQTVARSKLVRFIQEEARKAGVDMSLDAIEERLRSNTKVRAVPACFAAIIENLDNRFLTGLTPIEKMTGDADPQEWLEARRRQLGFRSHNAMHKAVAQASGLNYEAVHKALTRPRNGQRIQDRIREVFEKWTAEAGAGRLPSPPAASSRVVAAPAAEVRQTLEDLARFFDTRAALCLAAAAALGAPSSVVQQFLASPDSPASFTAAGLRSLKALLRQKRKAPLRISYLASEATRRLAQDLTAQVGAVRAALKNTPDSPSLRRAFKSLRLQLIMAMKQRWTRADLDSIHDTVDVEPDHDDAYPDFSYLGDDAAE
ncbi:MAG TPA: hypothetical protein P5137_04325 [Candidatus Brocadiia bacterium]|nr:hypothetical protein [Candidatus Brocadiia bacterium]